MPLAYSQNFLLFNTIKAVDRRNWIISYLSSLLNLRFVYTTLYTHVTHILSLKKNGLPVRNIGIYQVLSTQYLLCCDPYLRFPYFINGLHRISMRSSTSPW